MENIISILRWYTDPSQRHINRDYVNDIHPLITEQNQIPPFQWPRATSGASITSFKLVKYSDGTETEVITQMTTAGLEIEATANYDLIKYPAIAPLAITPILDIGIYSAVMTDNTSTWYSEYFVMCDDTSKMIKVEYCHAEDFTYPGGHFTYINGYKNYIWIKSDIGKPSYQYEEQVTPRNGQKFPNQQISYKQNVFEILATEPLLDAFRAIRLHDFVKVYHLGKTYTVDEFIMDEPRWQEVGDIAAVDVEFRTDTILLSVGRGVTAASCDLTTGQCISSNWTVKSTIPKDGVEYVGQYYVNELGVNVNFQDGDLVLVEDTMADTIQLYLFQIGLYIIQSPNPSDVAYSEAKERFYMNGLISHDFFAPSITQVQDLGGGNLRILWQSVNGTTNEFWAKDAGGNETLLAVRTASTLFLSVDFIQGDYVAVQMRVSSIKCPQFDITPWESLPMDISGDCNIVIQGAYDGPSEATSGGVLVDEYYETMFGNHFGWPEGMVFQLTPTTTYLSDAQASGGGVTDGQCFAVVNGNIWDMTQHAVKQLNPVSTYFGDENAGFFGVAIGEVYALAEGNDYDVPGEGFLKVRKS